MTLQDVPTGNAIAGVPVQLTRMEGVLNLVAFQVADHASRLDRHETDIGFLKSLSQSLKEGAEASKETAVALALALKDAKETQEATARTKVAESEHAWSPWARSATALGGIAVVWTLIQAVLPG